MNRKLLTLVTVLMLTAVATPVFAGIGFHAGLSIDPDDFIIGARFKSHPIEERLFVVPSLTAGFGDITMFGGDLDLQYKFATSSRYAPYAGGGLTIFWYDFDGGSNTEVGGNILGGVMLDEKWFLEAKIGLGDIPDFRLIVGFESP